MRRALPLALLALAAPGPAGAGDDENAKALRGAEVKDRLAAVRRITEAGGDDAEALLLEALKDRDWEVAVLACAGLAKHGTAKAALRPLAETAVSGPARCLRLAAAAALGTCAREEGGKLVASVLASRGDEAGYAAEALAEIRSSDAAKPLLATLKHKGAAVRREAAEALGTYRDPASLPALEALLKDPDVGVRAGAVEGMARCGALEAVPVLITWLQSDDLLDLIERRMQSAIRRILLSRPGDPDTERASRSVVGTYRSALPAAGTKAGAPGFDGPEKVSARLARVLGSIGRALPPRPKAEEAPADGAAKAPPKDPPPPPASPLPPPGPEGVGPVADPAPIVEALAGVGLKHPGMRARRAAAAALGRVGGDAALAALAKAIVEDPEAPVRFHALRAFARWRTAKDEDGFQVFAKTVRYDKSPLVREEAAVRLGVRGLEGAVSTLAAALADPAWEVACASAVSLGKTRSEKALEPLVALLAHKEWRLRGAAAAGIGHTRLPAAVPPLLGALADPEPAVQRTAWEFLKRLAAKDLPLRKKEWDEWWATASRGFVVVDREAEIRDAQKHGYSVRDQEVYAGLDVVVFQGRSGGDHIEKLLDHLKIAFRLTQQKAVPGVGLQPFGVFVANCTGEMQKEDYERVQWFVHTGGALFASCWSIDKTVGTCFPDTIRKFPGAKGQVLDFVRAEAQPTDSGYLDGVFPPLARPMYVLEGAFLVETLDPERCEVLIDSPDCATRWFGGNMAAWFTAGHGVVMGSSNHFDLQGLDKANVSTEVERMSFAMDHLGLSFAQVRDLRERGVFARQPEAVREARDLSAFRFVTNFVRRKRILDE